AGRFTAVDHKPTLSEATAGGIEMATFDIVQQFVDEMVIVSESEIGAAIRFLLLKEHLVVEGAGALPTAAVLAGKLPYDRHGATVLVLSGRNIDPEKLLSVLDC
ncbi:MAG: pyridoxal-phosphate dependent enzyme, partial [Thermaerobacterales bacterium]